MNLVLGTAQFGQIYGVTNNSKNHDNKKELDEILSLFLDKGFNKLDTAQSYGNSEKMLGLIGVDEFHITSKIKFPENLSENKNRVIESIERSLENLRIDSLDCLLAHNSNFLKTNKNEAIDLINSLKKKNLIKQFGVSVYEPSDLIDTSLLEVIQFPCNIFDQRFINLNNMNDGKIIWQCRSIFLQGILLEPLNRLPIYFKRYLNTLKDFHTNFPSLNERLSGCINFIMQQQFQEFLVGVSCTNDLKDIFSAMEKFKENSSNHNNFNEMSSELIELIDPRLWRTN